MSTASSKGWGARADREPFPGVAVGSLAFQGRWDLGGTVRRGDACSGGEAVRSCEIEDQPEHPPGVCMGVRELGAQRGYQRGWERHIPIVLRIHTLGGCHAAQSTKYCPVIISYSKISVAWPLFGLLAAESLGP